MAQGRFAYELLLRMIHQIFLNDLRTGGFGFLNPF